MPGPYAVCGATATKQCGKCHTVYYCGADHQLQHWRVGGHREQCQGRAAHVPSAQMMPNHPNGSLDPMCTTSDVPTTMPRAHANANAEEKAGGSGMVEEKSGRGGGVGGDLCAGDRRQWFCSAAWWRCRWPSTLRRRPNSDALSYQVRLLHTIAQLQHQNQMWPELAELTNAIDFAQLSATMLETRVWTAAPPDNGVGSRGSGGGGAGRAGGWGAVGKRMLRLKALHISAAIGRANGARVRLL